MEIKTIRFTPKMLQELKKLEREAIRRGLSVDYEAMRLTTVKPSNKNQWWLEGDQDTPDYFKEESDEG